MRKGARRLAGSGVSIALVVAMLLAWPVCGGAQESREGQDPPVYKSSAELTVLRVAIVSGGAPAMDLVAEDLQVLEGGQERAISVFIPPAREPLEIVLAIDVSGSMISWPWKEAATRLLDSLHPGSCVLLMPFRESPGPAIWGHPAEPGLRQALAGMEPQGDEAIFDAVLASFALLREHSMDSPQGRPASDRRYLHGNELVRFRALPATGDAIEIPEPRGRCTPRRTAWATPEPAPRSRQTVVVITDGHDHASRSSLDEVLLVAWGSGIPTFVLAGESPSPGPGYYATMRKLKRFLEYTGGALLLAPQPRPRDPDRERENQRFWDVVQGLIAGLRAQYVLGVVPTTDNASGNLFHDRRDIEVRIRRPGDWGVLASGHVVRGRVADETSSLDQIHRGFQEMADGRFGPALAHLDAVASAASSEPGPHTGVLQYGRGIALAKLERHSEALEALRRAAEHAPWLPDLDARQAELLLQLTDVKGAWQHAIRAHWQGSEVTMLVERLQALAPRADLDLGRVARDTPVRIVVSTRGRGDAALQGIAVPAAFSAIVRAVASVPDVIVSTAAPSGQDPDALRLEVAVDRIRQREARIEARATITLATAGGDKLLELPLQLHDVRVEEDVEASASAAARSIRTAIGIHLSPRQR